MIRLPRWLPCLALAASSCAIGDGSGRVVSDRLYVKDCWDGTFDLRPTFFASDPFGDTQQIRVQRGERMLSVSDGVSFLVNDVTRIRSEQLGQEIDLGLPIGVRPPGFPVRVTDEPPQVSLALYLNDTCHVQNGSLYSIAGKITFTKLFSGDRNEKDSDARLTEASFTATVADPRDATLEPGPDGGALEPVYSDDVKSEIEGEFRFLFQRGNPAQPFP